MKNIIFCFDGTCNHPRDAKQERSWFGLGEIEDNGITNVLKLHALFGGDLSNEAHTKKQHSLYYSGVGTYGNRFQQIFNAMFAPQTLDVGDIINRAGRDLGRLYKPGDRIFLFGFSRGAAIARRFAAVIHNYLPTEVDCENIVTFMGVFDTVAAIGIPNLDDDEKPVSDVVFENGTVSAHVNEALHLLAIDENRTAFQPTLMNKSKQVSEIWFSGAHADVGGGFWFDGLSDISLQYLIDEFKRRKLGLTVKDARRVDYSKLCAADGSYQIDLDDVFIKPNHKGKTHPKDRWGPFASATLSTRRVRVNIDDVRSPSDSPIIHFSVVDRIRDVVDYRPKSLKGLKHKVLGNNLRLASHQGVIDYIA